MPAARLHYQNLAGRDDSGRYYVLPVRHGQETHDDAVGPRQERHYVQKHPGLLGEDRQAGGADRVLQGGLFQHSARYRRRPRARVI